MQLEDKLNIVFWRELHSDDATMGKELGKLYLRYEEGDVVYRKGIDDALCAVVGWTLPTLVAMAKAKKGG